MASVGTRDEFKRKLSAHFRSVLGTSVQLKGASALLPVLIFSQIRQVVSAWLRISQLLHLVDRVTIPLFHLKSDPLSVMGYGFVRTAPDLLMLIPVATRFCA